MKRSISIKAPNRQPEIPTDPAYYERVTANVEKYRGKSWHEVVVEHEGFDQPRPVAPEYES